MRERATRTKARVRRGMLVTAVLAAAVLWLQPAAARISRSIETQMVDRIGAVSAELGRNFERLIFRDGFVSPDARVALDRAVEWAENNQFPKFAAFGSELSFDEVDLLFALLKEAPLRSSPALPVYQDLTESGQTTVITLPFDGEMFIVQGNEENVSHTAGTTNVFAWDFVMMKNGQMSKGNTGRNEGYHAWGLSVLAPAAGKVTEAVGDNEDHRPMTTKMGPANYVKIDHGNGEVSRIYHLQRGSLAVQVGQRVERGQKIGLVGDSGTSMFPHIHYQLDRGKEPIRARFAAYLVRDSEKEPRTHLVVSGVPHRGEYVRNIPTSGTLAP